MAFARFFRMLALVALCSLVGLSVAWAWTAWLPVGEGEIAAFDAAYRTLCAPGAAALGVFCGSHSGADLLAAPLALLPDLRWSLLALLLPLLVLAWSAGAGAHALARALPAADGGSVAEVERRLGVGRRASLIQQDAQAAAAWRAVLLALLPVIVLISFRHLTPAPFVAAHAAAGATLLAASEGFRHRLPSLLWGLVLGLGLGIDPPVSLVLAAGPLLGAVLQPAALKPRALNMVLGLGLAALFGGGAVAHLTASGFFADGGAWSPLPLLGLPALVLLSVGPLGLAVRRPGWHPALGVWLGALLSVAAVAVLDGGLGRAALFAVVPLAVLAGLGWGRWRVLTSPAGTTLLSLGSLAALLLQVQASGLVSVPLGPLAPISEAPVPEHARADQDALGWLGVEGGGAVLDLAQVRDGWGGDWLALRALQGPSPMAVTVLFDGRAYSQHQACEAEHVLVLHTRDPWFDADQVAAAQAGWDPSLREAMRADMALSRLCYRVERVEDAPGGGRMTFLARRPGVAGLLTGHELEE
ncbi:MAG: hypothetical protein ABIO70_32915 [Pseudomonadota bacterium]